MKRNGIPEPHSFGGVLQADCFFDERRKWNPNNKTVKILEGLTFPFESHVCLKSRRFIANAWIE